MLVIHNPKTFLPFLGSGLDHLRHELRTTGTVAVLKRVVHNGDTRVPKINHCCDSLRDRKYFLNCSGPGDSTISHTSANNPPPVLLFETASVTDLAFSVSTRAYVGSSGKGRLFDVGALVLLLHSPRAAALSPTEEGTPPGLSPPHDPAALEAVLVLSVFCLSCSSPRSCLVGTQVAGNVPPLIRVFKFLHDAAGCKTFACLRLRGAWVRIPQSGLKGER